MWNVASSVLLILEITVMLPDATMMSSTQNKMHVRFLCFLEEAMISFLLLENLLSHSSFLYKLLAASFKP